ncbi:MAG: transposase [Magnetovibrio sp.]|nr:transposase [Magnetovibrio sp.]
MIKQYWLESGCAYGYGNNTKDMKGQGESCGKNHVYRIVRTADIRSQRGYKRHRGFKGGGVCHIAPNTLDRQV